MNSVVSDVVTFIIMVACLLLSEICMCINTRKGPILSVSRDKLCENRDNSSSHSALKAKNSLNYLFLSAECEVMLKICLNV